MARFLYKLKNDKLFLALFVFVVTLFVFDLFMIIFDIIQFVKLSQNSVNVFDLFVFLNVLAGVMNVLAIAVIIVYFVLDSRRIKTDNKTRKK